MIINKLFNKIIPKKKEEEPVELEVNEEYRERVNVRIENLTSLDDVDFIIKLVRDGNIIFLKTKNIQNKDLGQFETSIQKLKRSCMNYGYDIAGTEEGYMIITPKFAKISRE